MITADVSSLYTNIKINRMIAMLKREFLACPMDFIFNRKIYIQKLGIPRGNNMSVSLANLYIKNGLDDKIINKFKPAAYFRFINDTFCIVNDSNNIEEEFESFAN